MNPPVGFRCEARKTKATEHGAIHLRVPRITTEMTSLATWSLYCAVKEEFDRHPIIGDGKSLEAGKAYSPASIGKAYYRAMGIKPFEERQPDFSSEIMGYAMTAYYGGRSECHYRCRPVRVYHTDITRMYPSVLPFRIFGIG